MLNNVFNPVISYNSFPPVHKPLNGLLCRFQQEVRGDGQQEPSDLLVQLVVDLSGLGGAFQQLGGLVKQEGIKLLESGVNAL